MTPYSKISPVEIDFSELPDDMNSIEEFYWNVGDCILVVLEDEFHDQKIELFRFCHISSGVFDFVRSDGEFLFSMLENPDIKLIRWVPIRVKNY